VPYGFKIQYQGLEYLSEKQEKQSLPPGTS
jgi:hypothetical protein